MNAISGAERTGDECLSNWEDLQSELRSKTRKRMRIINAPGRKMKVPNFTPTEKMVLNVMCAAGNETIDSSKESSEVQKIQLQPASSSSPSLSSQSSTTSPESVQPQRVTGQELTKEELSKRQSWKKKKHVAIERQRLLVEEERLQIERQRLEIEKQRLQVEKQKLDLETEKAKTKRGMQRQGRQKS